MKKLFLILVLFSTSVFGQITPKWLSTADSVLEFVSQGAYLEIAVWDTGAADTITLERVWTVDDTTLYPDIGQIKDLTAGADVTQIIGSVDEKLYLVWQVGSRGTYRLILSEFASGDVYVQPAEKSGE